MLILRKMKQEYLSIKVLLIKDVLFEDFDLHSGGYHKAPLRVRLVMNQGKLNTAQ